MLLSDLRILLVDDYEPMRELKTILLQRAGAFVLEAKNGREALRVMETELPGIALLDINLPDMSAVELGEAMRARTETASIPVIYTSASERPDRLPPDAVFIQEPIDKTELFNTILRLVRC